MFKKFFAIIISIMVLFTYSVIPVYADNTTKTTLYPINEELMFKVVDAHLESNGNNTDLVFCLNGTGYQYVFAGTYDEAIKNGKNSSNWIKYVEATVTPKYATDREIDDPNYQEYEEEETTKYQFRVPVKLKSQGTTKVSLISISESRRKKAEKENPDNPDYSSAFIWRQLVIDTSKGTLRTGNYVDEFDMSVLSSPKSFDLGDMVHASSIGTPSANEYTLSVELTIRNDLYDKAYRGTSEDASKANNEDLLSISDGGKVSVTFQNSLGKDPQIVDGKATLAFRVKKDGSWVDRSFVFDTEAKTVTVSGTEIEMPDNTGDEDQPGSEDPKTEPSTDPTDPEDPKEDPKDDPKTEPATDSEESGGSKADPKGEPTAAEDPKTDTKEDAKTEPSTGKDTKEDPSGDPSKSEDPAEPSQPASPGNPSGSDDNGSDAGTDMGKNSEPGNGSSTDDGSAPSGDKAESKVITLSKANTKITNIKGKTWTGKKLTQSPTVKVNGVKLVKGTDYKLTYTSRKNVGKATVKIVGKGKYKGTIKKTFKIRPKGTAIKTVKAAKKALTIKWKKQSKKMSSKRITGYEVWISTSSKFTKKTTQKAIVKGYKKTSYKFTKLKAKKKYYIKVRTYRTISGVKYYSTWSKMKTKKTK